MDCWYAARVQGSPRGDEWDLGSDSRWAWGRWAWGPGFTIVVCGYLPRGVSRLSMCSNSCQGERSSAHQRRPPFKKERTSATSSIYERRSAHQRRPPFTKEGAHISDVLHLRKKERTSATSSIYHKHHDRHVLGEVTVTRGDVPETHPRRRACRPHTSLRDI